MKRDHRDTDDQTVVLSVECVSRMLGVSPGLVYRLAHSGEVRRRFYRDTVAPPKTKYGRRQLRLSDGLSRALWVLRKDTKAADDDLVFTTGNGTRIDASNLMTRILKPAAVEAELGTGNSTDESGGGP